jgi:hypothetical protein
MPPFYHLLKLQVLHSLVKYGNYFDGFKLPDLILTCVSMLTKFCLMSTDSAYVLKLQLFTVTK